MAYIGLNPGQQIAGTPIDVAFIGSCTNGRLSDLEAAADVARGRKVAPGVKALVVPGAAHVKAAAEAAGLHRIFLEAGFEWRESGVLDVRRRRWRYRAARQAVDLDLEPQFRGAARAGQPTHLASPAMVAAAAVTGCITDVRTLLN